MTATTFAVEPNPNPNPEAEADAEKTRAAMRKIYTSLQILLPLAMEPERFGAPENAAAVRSALDLLATEASLLDLHAQQLDPGAFYIGRELERDSLAAKRAYAEGDPYSAAYSVHRTTDACLACHSRWESGRDAVITNGFLDQSVFQALDPVDRARLLFATRQFSKARELYEQQLRSNRIPPPDRSEVLLDYLILVVRVERTPERAIPVVRQVAQRDDLWMRLREDLLFWADKLEEQTRSKPRFFGGSPVSEARRLVEQASREVVLPSDRRALIHYVIASRLLNDYVRSDPASPELASEAYYLLGHVESRLGNALWFSPSEYYLELAIRLAPETEAAHKAYALLEEELLISYSMGGVPEDMGTRLSELKELVLRAQPDLKH